VDKTKREPMGRVVGERADHVIVTNDNPRDEDPGEIARALAAGCRRGGRAYVALELDRGRAITRALETAKNGDVVVVAGKGHERGQTIGDRTRPFSDVDEIRRALGQERE
jgi:UDP-N-acetylmuramoyl-L-alanyl-D-glutamate--2,6-diaminopimelate ligase